VEPPRDGDAGDRDVDRRGAVDASQIAQMGGAGGDKKLVVGLGSRAAAAGQAILLEEKGRSGRRPLSSSFVLIF
jgi:hypothetical protein